MASSKYGLFKANAETPRQEFEGEYLEVHGDMVSIVAGDGSGHERTFAVIRLEPDQCIKKISGK